MRPELTAAVTKNQVYALLAAPLLSFIVYWLTASQGALVAGSLAVTVFAAVLWISEVLPLPVTALLIPVGLVGAGVFDAKQAYLSFGNPVLFLVLGGYALAVAVEVNEIGQWLARKILLSAGNQAFAVLTAFMLTSALLSMLISNTATTALLLPVVLGVLSRHDVDENLSQILLLGVAYGASIGGVATLTGSPPNAIAAGLLDISFLQWLAYGMPVAVSMLILAIPLLWWTCRPQQQQLYINTDTEIILSGKAKRTLSVVGVTLALWLFGPATGDFFALPAALFSSAAVAGVAIALLIVSRSLVWRDLEKGIHWGVLLLLGGGLTLGRGLTESGAAAWLAATLTVGVGDLHLFFLLFIFVAVGVFATELISNTAVTAKLAPILMGIALQLGLEAESLVVPVAIATSMAFMLPVATPPNALVHDTGHVKQRDMMRVGFRLNLVAIMVIATLFYFGISGNGIN